MKKGKNISLIKFNDDRNRWFTISIFIWISGVIFQYLTIYAIAKFFIHIDSNLIRNSNKQINKIGIFSVRKIFIKQNFYRKLIRWIKKNNLSDVNSRQYISLAARFNRRYCGATVKAVTCPCQLLPVPSILPITWSKYDCNKCTFWRWQKTYCIPWFHHWVIPLYENIRANELNIVDKMIGHRFQWMDLSFYTKKIIKD